MGLDEWVRVWSVIERLKSWKEGCWYDLGFQMSAEVPEQWRGESAGGRHKKAAMGPRLVDPLVCAQTCLGSLQHVHRSLMHIYSALGI